MPKDQSEYMAWLKEGFLNVDMLAAAKSEVQAFLCQAANRAMQKGSLPQNKLPQFVVEIPGDTTHGDFAANIALVWAKTMGMPPRSIAQAIVANAETMQDGGIIERVEIAGPGFINVFFNASWFCSVVMAAVCTGGAYGRTNYGGGEKVNLEFVSANPTGPMHIGNARGGALGDVLSEVMAWAGYNVTREFYVNDAGNQIAKFGASLAVRYLQLVEGEAAHPFPEDGYRGEDIKQLAKEFYDINGSAAASTPGPALEEALVDYALPKNIAALKTHLERYNIYFDVWFNETQLHQSGQVMQAVALLTKRGATYEKDGAVWYRATAYGAEKDEVLVRANGFATYFAADIAYHANKFSRGFTKAIDVWGADHHGHVARLKGVLAAMGLDESRLDIVLMQFVTLMEDGQPVKMSKRTGKSITLTDLLDEVPLDSARFFFNMREPSTTVDFDMGLAVQQDAQNPVYYVQYAHARICSILRLLAEENICFAPQTAFPNLGLLSSGEERELVRKIACFSSEIIAAVKSYDPSKITKYVTELAAAFHKFYNACHVKGEGQALQSARIALCVAAKTVIENALKILKVSAPEKM